jgi:hypothetical protein
MAHSMNGLDFEILNKNPLLYLVHEAGLGSLHKKMPPLLLTDRRERSPSWLLDSMRSIIS